MTIPSNAVQVDGQGAVTGDQLNTFVQVCPVVTDARGFIGVTGMSIVVTGFAVPADGGFGVFYWNASNAAADDGGITTIVPTGAASGAWTRAGPVRLYVAAGGGVETLALSNVLQKVSLVGTAGAFDNAGHRYQPTVPGNYQFNASVSFTGTTLTTGIIYTNFYKNGVSVWAQAAAAINNVTLGFFGQDSISTILPMNGTTDYVELWAGAAASAGAISGSQFNAQWLSP